jgi:TetR/AcrR family transcriptional regulator, transcriptional repressor for nem operon
MIRAQTASGTRAKLLDAARDVIRTNGYAGSTVDDICAAAGVTKGSFFHYFDSKEELGVAAIERFGAMAATLFANAPYRSATDPRDRVLGYVDFRISLLHGEIPLYTCLIGTTVQEAYASHPNLRDACDRILSEHIAELTRDVAAAKARYAPAAFWNPESVGYFMQCVLQGAFIFAKVKQNAEIATASLGHLRNYLVALLGQPEILKEQGVAV